MVAYSFKKRFGPPILAGTKAQTIRAERAGKCRHARPGEQVQLYTGMRTKHCRRLAEAVCLEVAPIRIELPRARRAPEVMIFTPEGVLARHILTARALANFARADGFVDFDEMVNFWRTEHPALDTFNGTLIRWQPLAPADALTMAAVA